MSTSCIALLCVLLIAGCGQAAETVEVGNPPDEGASVTAEGESSFDPGTEEDRAALFEYLVEKTMERDAFASLRDHPFYGAHPKGIDVVAEMEKHRDDLIAAETDVEIWFALRKISNARKDRHLGLSLVDGGLELPEYLYERAQAPIQFKVDYSDEEERFFFVGELGADIEQQAEGETPSIGDRLVRVNDRTAQEFADDIRPYKRYSTDDSFWWMIADEISRTWDSYYGYAHHLPHSEFYGENLEWLSLELEREDGSRYEVELPYMDPDDVEWQGYADRYYPGFTRVPELDEFETYRDVYLSDDEGLPIIILDWFGFRGDLLDAMDRLMEYADEHDLLDHHVIVDATRARGGSNGAYALARLQPEPFRTTFGNLMVSDVMERWVEDQLSGWEEEPPSPSRGQDDVLVREWLESDVQHAIEEGNLYTNDVPFKGVQPKWADGIVEPAEKHFTGGLTVWLSPEGGSHLDQFTSQVVDNDIGYIIGMETGGYSNKWSTTEVLEFPTTGQPIVGYEWSMGHSIRANKEILQYNPAEPHEYIPQTRENYLGYHEMLLEKTLERLNYHR